MSDVLHDEWDRAYEEGREAGRREAWSGDYDYRTLIAEARAAALRDAETAVLSVTREIDKDEMRWLFQGLRGER